MFSFFRHSRKKSDEIAQTSNPSEKNSTDMALIAAITAAIARFREEESGSDAPAGFVVRRVRRV